MKKSKKIILRAIPVVIACLAVVTVVVGGNVSAISTDVPSSDGGLESINSLANSVWGTITVVAQILAFAAIIFAGIRYMFASADAKADIKKQTVILVVGAILVFGASTVVQILMNILNDVSGQQTSEILNNVNVQIEERL